MSSVIVSSQNEIYAGKCKDRCENNRGGGPHAFLLKCKSTYYSEEEITQCIKDCTLACPIEKYCPSGDTILCEPVDQGLDKSEIDLEDYKIKLRQEYEDDLFKTQDKVEAEFIPLAVVFGIVVILAIALSVWACYRKKKKLAAARAQMQQTQPLDSTINVQPYPPPAVHRHDLKVDGRVNSDGRVFIDGRANNNL